MKKNKMMRLASALLVLTLLSTSAISGTFAKYVTSGTASDSARVAKFGVTVSSTGNLFAESYTGEENGSWKDKNTVAVVSAGSTDLVAPGTDGELATITISGKPEVAVKISYEATVTLSSWEIGTTPTYYCPLEVKAGNETLKGTDYTSADLFAAAIKEAIDGYSKEYGPNIDLTSKEAENLDITWSWPFESNNDANDTLLGDKGNDTIMIQVKTIVTQID